ncbi:MAG: FAD/NAD(P)-binding protein [Candidatus Altiarchaeota archaeon]
MNEYEPIPAIVEEVRELGSDSMLLTLGFKDKTDFKFTAGQFIELGILGYGEIPVGIASSPGNNDHIQVSVREVGNVTKAIHRLEEGDEVGVRGPYGNGFKDEWIQGKNLIIIGGGCGIPPLRSLLLYALENPDKFNSVQMLYGSKSRKDLLFQEEYGKWRDKVRLLLTVDTGEGWEDMISDCQVGVVTNLIDDTVVKKNSVAALCGPPIMYKFVVKKLMEYGMKPSDILVSLERRMKCGIGKCQHCNRGSKYVCLDGPVFTYQELLDEYGGL